MTTSPDQEIQSFLASFQPPIGETARRVVATLRRLRPDLSPHVRLGWGSINFRHPRAGHICAVFPLRDRVSLYFEHGRLLGNESGLLQGNAKQVRFIPFEPGQEIPEEALGLLLAEAVALKS